MRLQPGLGPAEMTTRTIWHSLEDKQTWEERIRRISAEVVQVERKSVLEKIRTATQQCLTPIEYHNVASWAARNGLYVKILRSVKAFFGFAHRYVDGNDYYVTVVANREWALDHPEGFLGYPGCCQAWFGKVFPFIVDPMWQWAQGQGPEVPQGNEIKIENQPIYSNPLLRYSNIRFSPHIPCSHDCEESDVLGYEMFRLMREEERDWAQQLLKQRIVWDNYRGVTVIGTNQFRIVQSGPPSAERYVVETLSA